MQKPPEKPERNVNNAQIARRPAPSLGRTAYDATRRVYFLEAIGLDLIKIGCASYLAERVRTIQRQCGAPVRLLGTLPGGMNREREVHWELADSRVHGEWFKRTPELTAFLETIDKPATVLTAAEIAARL